MPSRRPPNFFILRRLVFVGTPPPPTFRCGTRSWSSTRHRRRTRRRPSRSRSARPPSVATSEPRPSAKRMSRRRGSQRILPLPRRRSEGQRRIPRTSTRRSTPGRSPPSRVPASRSSRPRNRIPAFPQTVRTRRVLVVLVLAATRTSQEHVLPFLPSLAHGKPTTLETNSTRSSAIPTATGTVVPYLVTSILTGNSLVVATNGSIALRRSRGKPSEDP